MPEFDVEYSPSLFLSFAFFHHRTAKTKSSVQNSCDQKSTQCEKNVQRWALVAFLICSAISGWEIKGEDEM